MILVLVSDSKSVMNKISMNKQMIINRLPVPTEIHDSIKEFLFYDELSSKSRRTKKFINDLLYCNLDYLNRNNGHWGVIVYGYIQLQAINCATCGEYIFAGSTILPDRARCFC
jgi:hypothetical protein